MPINSFLYPGAKVTSVYEVANSLRFNDDDSPMLQITPSSSATSSRKMTISFWCKRSNLGINGRIFSADTSGSNNNRDSLFFDSNDKLYLFLDNGSPGNLRTNRLFRDTSAWYHIVIAIDTTQSTDTNRVKFYVNGVQETSFDSSGDGVVYPSQNYDILGFGQNGREATIGADTDNGGNDNEFDGYLTELVFIDGQQLDADQFGEFDSDSNIWKPKDVSGLTFGNNGFYLDFEDSSALGNDVSGNNNDFSVTNLAAIDQSTDTCTNNFCTMNPLLNLHNGTYTYEEGNLLVQSNVRRGAYSSFGVSSGKWYCEAKLISFSNGGSGNNLYAIGISSNVSTMANDGTGDLAGAYAYVGDGTKETADSASSYGNTYTTNDIIGIALNLDDNELKFYKNGTVQNSGTAISITAPASTVDGFYFFNAGHIENIAKWSWNFGNPAFSISSGNSDANGYGNFEYSVPSGYYSLCTKNLAEYG